MITLNNLNADSNCWKECVQYDEDDCSVLLIDNDCIAKDNGISVERFIMTACK